MSLLSSALVLLAGTALVAASPTAPAAPVAPIKYKAVIVSKQIADLTVVGGEKQESGGTSTTFFQLEIIDSAGGHVLHIVIDSLVPDASNQVPAAVLDSARGSVYHHFLDASGKLTEKTITNGGAIATGFASSTTQFVPRLRGSLEKGSTWSDTTDVARTIPNGALKVKSVTNYEVLEPGKVGAAFASSQTGAQESANGTLEIAGTSKGTATWTLAADRSIVSFSRKDEANVTITVAAAPAPIPLTQTQDATITRVQ